MRRITTRLTFPVLAALLLSRSAIQADELARTITVRGEGRVSAAPDMATITTGVETHAATAKDALTRNSAAMQQIMKVLTDFGIASKDMQTSNFSIYPDYKRTRENQANEVVGYRVLNQLHVKVRDLPQLGKVLDALVQAGSNRIGGVTFGIAEPEGVTDQARVLAIKNAADRAKLYADAAGAGVGKVLQISEQAVHIPVPQPMMRTMAMAEAGSVPVAGGELDIRANITVVYTLTD